MNSVDPAGSHAAVPASQESTWRDDGGLSTTEVTPLLRSTATSRPTSSRSSIPDAGFDGLDKDLDLPKQTVSRRRGIAIALSVYLLIFLQGSITPPGSLRETV